MSNFAIIRHQFGVFRTKDTPSSDNLPMSTALQPRFPLAAAAVKATSAWARRFGFMENAANWEEKAALCERCHLRVLKCNVSYCGKPFLQHMDRDPSTEGCGCPCIEKAKSPGEHCPLDNRHLPAVNHDGNCTCKWCSLSVS
jgi:hypothetical protein